MKLNGLALLFENLGVVLAIVVLAIVFFVFLEKQNKRIDSTPNDDQSTQSEQKWHDVSRMDIVSSKVGVLFLGLLVLIFFAVNWVLKL